MADNDGMQDWAADYDVEGQEQAARDGRDSGVSMMAGVVQAWVGHKVTFLTPP